MRQRRFLCLCFLVMSFIKPYAQVSLPTGSGNFSLPIFNWQDDKSRLNSIVALSYNSGNGLKVNEVASNVGQGWNMVAGGVISRAQNGEPDDQVEKPGAVDDVTKYPAGKLYANVPATNGYSTAYYRYPIFGSQNKIYTQHNAVAEDKQLDYFNFQFNGKAGTFVLDPTALGTARSIGDTKMKITFQTDIAGLNNLGIRTSITSFSIQDVDGLIYRFAAKGVTKILQTDFCDEFYGNRKRQPRFRNDKVYYQTMFDEGPISNPFVVNNWYLTEIEDALTHRKIYFNYGATRSINHIAGDDITINKTRKDYAIVSRKISIEQIPALTSINYPDGHNTNFNYGAARIDLNGDYTLSSVDVLYQGRYLSRHELNTTYFILNRYGTPTTDYQKRVARLCLKSVRKIGVDLKEDTPPYIFDYYTGSGLNGDFVPIPFSVAKDIWGYNNGNNSEGFWLENVPPDATPNQINHYNTLKGLCYLRQASPGALIINPKAGYAKNGLLKQIIYPTGGTLSYEYEQNTGMLNGSAFNAGGVHVSKTSSTDGGGSNDCNNPITTQYKYLNEGGQSSLWGLEVPNNQMTNTMHYEKAGFKFTFKPWKIPPLRCAWDFQYPGIQSQTQAISQASIRNMAILTAVSNIMNVIGTISDIMKIADGASLGTMMIIDLILEVVEFVMECLRGEKNNSNLVYYNTNLNAISPLPTQFKRVEVVENNGGIGKTVQEFTSDDDYPIWENANPTYSAKQRFAPWAYGLPKITSVYDAAGQLIKQTRNEYSLSDSCYYIPNAVPYVCYPKAKVPMNLKSAKALVKKMSSQRSDYWNDPNIYNNSYQAGSGPDMDVEIYDMYTGRVELKSTAERIFKSNDPAQFLETKTQYFYNSGLNYDVNKIVTTQSNGDINSKLIKYSSDYNTGVLATLVQNNIVSLPVSTASTVTKSGNNYDLSINVSEFLQLANGDVKTLRSLERRFASPAVSSGHYGGPGSDISAYKITQTFSYDALGNLTGVKDEGNRTITNIYDYDDKYIIASVINADPVTDKTAYTSFETTSFGKWTLTGSPVYSTTTAMTGTRSFTLSAGKSFNANSLNTARPYIVSFWSTTATITVTGGATLVKSAPTINGLFTYYEYNIAQGTSSVTVAGSGTIDELRIYPQTARMRTVTYEPIIGKTSECDENNRITYYEYDVLGRLKLIKDEKKNIVKMYEYNNISAAKQNGCPGIFYNKYISELFVRNNCTSGYIGDTARFIVPANMFSSTLSQADADAKAEFYLLTNGQNYANNNGLCLWVYSNVAMSQNFESEGCPPGYIGGTVTYTVPAGRYTSLISQQDANDKAQDDIDANGVWYANSPEHRNCTYYTNADWEWLEGDPYYCQAVNGVQHLFILLKDINPNSASYGQTQWMDVGPNELCGSGGGGLYYNTVQFQTFTKNDCAPGYTGSSVTYTVAANTYSSTVSVADANQLALNDIAANGQNYANANGTCTLQGCAYENCHALNEANQCINGQCEMGIRINDETYYDYQLNQWVCVYHYEYSNGFWTAAFIRTATAPVIMIKK